jgi:hypothetical protein
MERQPLANSRDIEDWNSFVMLVKGNFSQMMLNSSDKNGGTIGTLCGLPALLF